MSSKVKKTPFTQSLDGENKKWFAIRVRPRCEKVVKLALEKKGIDAYVPIQRKTRYYSKKVKKVELPLIKGYVLTSIILEDYVKVLDTENVIGFIRSDQAPAPIPESAIELLRRVEGSTVQAESVALEDLQHGAHMEIIGGDLTGMIGRICEVKGREFVSIELIHMDAAIVLDIDKKYIRLL